MEEGLADWRATGTGFLEAYTLALLAEAKASTGQISEALALLEDALIAVSDKNQGLYEAELHRLKGEFLLQQGAAAGEVELLFQQAIEIAQRRQALSQELRAVVACSLW